MSNSAAGAAKLATKSQSQPKSGVLETENQQQQLVSIASPNSAKTPPVRQLTRSISSKPGVERKTIPKTKIHKELIKAKVKSNPALFSKDGNQGRFTKDGSPARTIKDEVGPQKFARRGEFCNLNWSILVRFGPFSHFSQFCGSDIYWFVK